MSKIRNDFADIIQQNPNMVDSDLDFRNFM